MGGMVPRGFSSPIAGARISGRWGRGDGCGDHAVWRYASGGAESDIRLRLVRGVEKRVLAAIPPPPSSGALALVNRRETARGASAPATFGAAGGSELC